MRIGISDEFKTAYKKLKKRHRSLESDFECLLLSLQENPFQGIEIHENIRKIRLNIISKSRGKSGGARVIIRIRIIEDELQLLYIYDKADFENVSNRFLQDILQRML
ncbi:MAG: addiction module toxin RelE [Bacteroidaceae bacterium]|nr:addiction module toxin RelE [Bacteroidaceae bacterium]